MITPMIAPIAAACPIGKWARTLLTLALLVVAPGDVFSRQ
jgi:hypothetical protein